MKNNFKYLAILALGLVACEPEFDNPVNEGDFYTSGSADFSNFVAVGNSLTAGFADGALYKSGQENSYPNILAQQFSLVGGGEFTQPLTADNAGGLLLNGNPIVDGNGVNQFPNRRVLMLDQAGQPVGPVIYTEEQATTDIANVLTGSFNNMGVPGAKSFHLLAEGYGNLAGVATGAANPYYVRFASSATSTVIGDAVAQNPSFFSLWIGNNDILSYATSGGVGVDQTGNIDPSTYGSNDITDPNVFANAYSQMVNALTANGAEGVLINLPDVTSIPFFTTVPHDAIPLDAATAAFLTVQFAPYNLGINQLAAGGAISAEEAARRQITFTEGQNAVVILDEDLTDLSSINPGLTNMRQATSEDLLVLTSSTVIGTLADPSNAASVIGLAVPLEDRYVLTTDEQALITTAQTSYNATIQALAEANDLAFFDAKSLLAQVASTGITFDGGTVTSTFASGGGFSLDGVHPTPRGYALAANGVIEAINAKYGATVPVVNPGNFGTVTIGR
ncbi:SGNH/GDSL hydrolase family protein [Aquimarina rhabdastrellae]